MNSYLITDMQGSETVGEKRKAADSQDGDWWLNPITCLDRAIHFYEQLCHELLAYASGEDVVRHLTADQAHVKRSFSKAYRDIDNSGRKTEFQKRSLLQRWKTLLTQLIAFYDNSKLNNSADIVKWRWDHLRLRAEKWQEQARTYDFAYFLCIFPDLTEEPWWNGNRLPDH